MTGTIIHPANNPATLKIAYQLLRDGQLVAFPTDTVYGVAAAVFNSPAISKLYAIKGREQSKAIPVLLGDQKDLPVVAMEISALAKRLAHAYWPGPLTLVVRKHPNLPINLSPYPTVGVRIPDHQTALALLNQCGPLAVTSANLSGQPNTCNANEVNAQLGNLVPLIIDGGQTRGGAPSTVVDCTQEKPIILREGPITLDQIQHTLEGK